MELYPKRRRVRRVSEMTPEEQDQPEHCATNHSLPIRAEGSNGKKIVNTTVNPKSILITALSCVLSTIIGFWMIDKGVITRERTREGMENFRNVFSLGGECSVPMPHKSLLFVNLLWREFRFLTVAGGSYGFYHTKVWSVVSTVNYIAMYSVMTLMMSLLAYTVYILQGHLSYMSQALNLLIVGMVVTTASVTLTFNRKKVESFEVFYADPWSLCAYSKNDYFQSLMENTARKKNKLIITWAILYGIVGVVGVNQTVIDNFFGTTSDVNNVNGAWLNLPFILWWPVDTTESAVSWLVPLVFELLFLGYGVIIVTSAVVLCFATADRLMDQFKLVIYGIDRLDDRAGEMFERRFPGSDRRCMEEEYDDCYYDCLVQNVKHQEEVVMWIERFVDMASLPVAVPFFGGAVLLGMALITITEEDDPRLGPKCFAAMSALTELYNMYLLCHLGQEMQQMSEDLFDALYGCRWSGRSERVKGAIRIMRLGCARPIKFTAAKLMVLNMELFADLVNSAYSIFNLKALSKEKDS